MGSVGSGNLGLKFDADDTVSMLDGSSSASMPQFTSSGGPKVKEEFNLSNYDAAEAAVAKLGSIMDDNYTNSQNGQCCAHSHLLFPHRPSISLTRLF